MKNKARINTLQIYYELKIHSNMYKINDPLHDGVVTGLRLALYHFDYTYDQLNDMEFVYNELIRLKK